MITKEQALTLKHSDILYHGIDRNSDDTPMRWRVNGKVKVWANHPEKWRIPVKHGMKDFGYLDETNNTEFFIHEYQAYLYGAQHGAKVNVKAGHPYN